MGNGLKKYSRNLAEEMEIEASNDNVWSTDKNNKYKGEHPMEQNSFLFERTEYLEKRKFLYSS